MDILLLRPSNTTVYFRPLQVLAGLPTRQRHPTTSVDMTFESIRATIQRLAMLALYRSTFDMAGGNVLRKTVQVRVRLVTSRSLRSPQTESLVVLPLMKVGFVILPEMFLHAVRCDIGKRVCAVVISKFATPII